MSRIFRASIAASLALTTAGLLGGCELYFGPDGSQGSGPGPAPGSGSSGTGGPGAGGSGGGSSQPPGNVNPALADRWLAFDSDRGTSNRDIYLVRGNGADLIRLTTETSTEKDPAFSHSGATLAFASDRSGTMQIHAMDLATGKVTQLTTLTAGADEPSFSSDDSRIVFHSGPSIYEMTAAGGPPVVLGTGLDDFNAYKYPSLSASTGEVLFSRNNEIDARKLDGSTQRYVVQNWTTTEETPAISPDGQMVVYAVGCGAVELIAITPLAAYVDDPCTAKQLTPASAGSARRPAWASNNVLAFERAAGPGQGAGSAQWATAVISGVDAAVKMPFDIVGPPGDNRDPSWAPVGFVPISRR